MHSLDRLDHGFHSLKNHCHAIHTAYKSHTGISPPPQVQYHLVPNVYMGYLITNDNLLFCASSFKDIYIYYVLVFIESLLPDSSKAHYD